MEQTPDLQPVVKNHSLRNKILLGLAGILLLTFLVFFGLSFIDQDELNGFRANLENGDLGKTSVSHNFLNRLQISLHRPAANRFRDKVDQFDGSLEPLAAEYPSAVSYLAYDSHSSDIEAAVARYYFLSGKASAAESLSLNAVVSDPYNFRARRIAVLCQAFSPERRERFTAASWDLISKNEQVINYYTEAKFWQKMLYYGWYLFERVTQKFIFTYANDNFLSLFNFLNQKRLEYLKKEEDWIKHQYAFSLFLTDPMRWENDANDGLTGSFSDAESLEERYVVATWKKNTPYAQLTYQQITHQKNLDPVISKRIAAFKAAYDAAQGYDQQISALKVYEPTHPENDAWFQSEELALKLPQDFNPSNPDAEGADNSLDWLKKVADGDESLPPGETKDDYEYPQFAQSHDLLDDNLVKTQTLPVCPLVMPLKNEQGRYTPLGGFISAAAVTRACFAEKMLLGPWSPFSTYKGWMMLENTHKDLPHLKDELLAETGAQSYSEGTLIPHQNGWTVSLTFKKESKTSSYSKTFKKGELHLIPNWIADRVHAWLGTKLTKTQKKALKFPLFSDDDSLQQSLILENFDFEQKGHYLPGWDGLYQKNLQSPFVLYRYADRKKIEEDVTDLKPLRDLYKKDPKNETTAFFLSYAERDAWMYGKAFTIQTQLLAEDQTNPLHYSDMADLLEPLNEYENVRHLYEEMAARFPNNPQVLYAVGDFFKNYAWVARGSGWGYSVSPWNGFLYTKRLETARGYLEKAAALNPQDCRIYDDLLIVGKGQSWKKAELDKVFNQSVSINPDYYPSFSSRMDAAKTKWGGADDDKDAMEFAKKWSKIHPLLLVDEIKEHTQGDMTDQTNKSYYRHLGTPEIWGQLNTAYQNYFKLVNMDNYDTWISYAYDCAYTDRVKDFLAFLRAQAETDPILDHFKPYLVQTVYEYRAEEIGWEHQGQLYLNTMEVWHDYYDAFKQICRQDPANYGYLNHCAAGFTGWGRFKLARQTFKLIGSHWVPSVWTRQKFEQYKRVAEGKEKPTWHMCLSPEQLRSEK